MKRVDKSKSGTIIGAAVAIVAGAAAAGIGLAARRSRISTRAWLANSLAFALAPDQNAPGALERGIEENRKKGPAPPPRKALKRLKFSDEHIGPDRVFRLLPRNQDKEAPWLFYLHGGAYVHEIQAIQWNPVLGLVERLHASVVAPVYPLAPEHSWREGLAAVRRVYASMASAVGAEKIVFVGDSAGGGLALALAQELRDEGLKPPAALVLFSPWLDVGLSGRDQPVIEERDPVLRIDYLRRAGRMWARDLALDDPRVSPLFGDQAGLPPTIVFSGDRDILDSDALRLAVASPGVDHRHYPEMIHVWPAAPIPEGRMALDEAAEFIGRHVGGAL